MAPAIHLLDPRFHPGKNAAKPMLGPADEIQGAQ